MLLTPLTQDLKINGPDQIVGIELNQQGNNFCAALIWIEIDSVGHLQNSRGINEGNETLRRILIATVMIMVRMRVTMMTLMIAAMK